MIKGTLAKRMEYDPLDFSKFFQSQMLTIIQVYILYSESLLFPMDEQPRSLVWVICLYLIT